MGKIAENYVGSLGVDSNADCDADEMNIKIFSQLFKQLRNICVNREIMNEKFAQWEATVVSHTHTHTLALGFHKMNAIHIHWQRLRRVVLTRTWWHPFSVFIVDSMFGALFIRSLWIALGLGAGWLRSAKLVLPTDSAQTVALRSFTQFSSRKHYNIFELIEKMQNWKTEKLKTLFSAC